MMLVLHDCLFGCEWLVRMDILHYMSIKSLDALQKTWEDPRKRNQRR